jgi:ketosteroid isomerase-like protein
VRFFRFPYLHEGDSPAKLEAMRDYLEASGQRNLPVTFDNPDWRFERPWVEARRAGDAEAMARIAEEYQETMHMAVRYHEEVTRQVYTRTVPQILLLHAGEVGAAQWDRLFTWLTERGYRFADVDEALLDPVFEQVYSYTGGAGLSRWERLLDDRRHLAAEAVVKSLLIRQTEAWNRGDLEAFTSAYADDAVFVSPSGLTRGRDEVLERYRRRYPDSAAMGRLRFEIVEMRPVSGHETSVLGETRPGGVHGLSVVARWHLEFPDDPGREPASGSTLLVLHREPGGHWRIVQDASM